MSEQAVKNLREELAKVKEDLQVANEFAGRCWGAYRSAQLDTREIQRAEAETNPRWEPREVHPLQRFGGLPEGPNTQAARKREKAAWRLIQRIASRRAVLLQKQAKIVSHLAAVEMAALCPNDNSSTLEADAIRLRERVLVNTLAGELVAAGGLALLQESILRARTLGHSEQAILRRVQAHRPRFGRFRWNHATREFLGLREN